MTQVRLRRRPGIPFRRLGRRFHDIDDPGLAQVPQPVCDRIGLRMRAEFVHETFVRERILKTQWRAQRSGKKRRLYGVSQDALTANASRASALAADASYHVGRHSVVAISQLPGGLGRCLWSYGLGRIPGKCAGDHVPWVVIPGTASERHRPRLALPRDNGSRRIDPSLLVDDACGSVVLAPSHLIRTRELHTDRPLNRVRQERRVIRYGISAVEPVTTRAAHEDNAHAVHRQPD